MGMDIHMSIVKDGKILFDNIYDGRDTAWFQNLMGRGCKWEYNHLKTKYGLSKQSPEDQNRLEKEGYFGFNHVKVSDFMEWYYAYKPYLDAGWVTKRTEWLVQNKGYILDSDSYDVHYSLNEIDGDTSDYVFTEFTIYESSRSIKKFIAEHEVPYDADICYYFDH